MKRKAKKPGIARLFGISDGKDDYSS